MPRGRPRVPEEVVLALLAEKNWEPVEGWEYEGAKTPTPGRCLVCGYESGPDKGPTYDSLKKGKGACKRCGRREKTSNETVRALLAEKNWEPIEGWEYVDNATPIPGRCLVEECDYEGPGPRYGDLKRGRGACRECSYRGRTTPEEDVRALLAEKNWEPIEGWEYVDNRTPIPGRCLVEGCGYEGQGPRYGSLKNGRGACFRCSRREKTSNETVRALLAEKNWEPVEGWEYINATTPVPGECLICGYESGPDKGPTYGNLKHSDLIACHSCSQGGGYDFSKPGVFYRFTFIEHGDRFQVYGITNNWDRRKKHYESALRRKTWKMSDVQTLYFDDGKTPQQIESDFNKIRIPLLDEVLPSQSEIKGTVEESFIISSPGSLELITVFEATWAEAQKLADSELVPSS